MDEGRRGRFFIIALPTLASTAIVGATVFQITYDPVSSLHASAGLTGAFVIMLAGFILNEQRNGRWYTSEVVPLLAGYAPVFLLSMLFLLLGLKRDAGPMGVLSNA